MRNNAKKTRYTLSAASALAAVAICFGLAAGQDKPVSQAPSSVSAGPSIVADSNYKIGPGDLLDVTVNKNETLSRIGIRVSYQGTIQLSMFDTDVQAACMTERELADAIKEKYRKYLVNPFVNVAVREFNSNPVAVIGAVNTPGRFQLQRSIRLTELLTFVNGPSPNAGRTVEILRNTGRPFCQGSTLVTPSSPGEELLSVSLNDSFKGGEQANPLILSGDIVRVAAADQMNAYVQGNVKAPAVINLKDPVSLTQAIAMAGGLSSGADTEKIKIRRQIAGSINRTEMIVNYKEITKLKKDDIVIQPNDIIEVPGPSGTAKVFQGIIKSIVPTITRLPISVIP